MLTKQITLTKSGLESLKNPLRTLANETEEIRAHLRDVTDKVNEIILKQTDYQSAVETQSLVNGICVVVRSAN